MEMAFSGQAFSQAAQNAHLSWLVTSGMNRSEIIYLHPTKNLKGGKELNRCLTCVSPDSFNFLNPGHKPFLFYGYQTEQVES